ncbi:MAG: AMP-binding protein, partial [Halioglobus sp.]
MRINEVAATLAEAKVLPGLARALKPRPLQTHDCFAARAEATAARYPRHTAIIFEGREISWSELNACANQYVGALRGIGLKRGQSVSVMLENRIEYVALLIALNKLGVAAALINTNLTGGPLVHCMGITDSVMCIFGEERLDAIADVRDDPALAAVTHY